MSSLHRVLLVSVAAALGASASPAFATPAEDLVTQGVALRKEGKDAEALDSFRKAYALEPTPRVRAQIALAELALGKFLEAEADLRAALAVEGDPWIAKNDSSLRAALHSVEDHLGWLVVDTVPGVEVRVDGRRIEKFVKGERLRVVAGTVRVEVSRPGESPARREVDVAPRKEGHVEISPPPPKPAPPVVVPPPVVVTKTEPSRLFGAGLVGLGVGSLGLGVYFGVRAFQQKSLRDDLCDASGCDAEGLVADRRMHDAAVWSTIGLVTGTVSTVVGGILLFRSRAAVGVQSTATGGTRLVLVGEF